MVAHPLFADILIKNARILAITDDYSISPDNYIAISGGVISAIGKTYELPAELKANKIIDASSFLIMPGLINTHNHCAMTLFRGMADDLPLMTWLQEHIFPAEAKSVTLDMVYWCSKLAAAEMILSGTTTVADGYFYEEKAANAFFDAGLRAVAAQGVIDFPAPGVPDPNNNIKYVERFIDSCHYENDLITPGIFCHSPYTCGLETIKKAKELARSTHKPFFIHVAETKFEVEASIKEHGCTPVKYLYDAGIMDSDTIFIHCVWLNDDDISLLAETNTKVVTCPESNMKLASGVAPISSLLDSGVIVSLGTDGAASNNNLDMFAEMDMCAKLHKVTQLEPTILPAKQLLAMATVNGAEVLGLGDKTGSIEVGKRADIIFVNLEQPHLTPFYNGDILVYSANGADVDTVIIDGKVIMEGRKIISFDVQEVIAKVREMSDSLFPA